MLSITQDDDTVLIQQIQDGVRVAFATLVTRHHQRFYRLAYRQVLDQHTAEDIVQDCFLKLWQKPEQFDAKRSTAFTAWFTRVVINRARDYQRHKTHIALDPEIPASTDDHDDNKMVVRQALLQLPDRQREAVNLCYYEGYSNQEAADMIGVKTKALESLLMRAKAKLKHIVQAEQHD